MATASTSVNVPTNTRIKEQDINAKLQLYGIYAAFAKGKVPSNKQIDVAMNTALEWNGLKNPNKKLSADGQQLVADLRHVIEQAKILLLSKNDGNLLQDFIWQTQAVGTGEAKLPGAPVDKDTAKQHGQQAVEGLRTLGQLLITNGQFRKLLSDASILLRDIAGDAATKAASKVNPSDDQLAQIDQPAEDHTWHEAPNLSKDNIKAQIQSKVPLKKQDAQDVANTAANAADQPGGADANAGAQAGSQQAKAKLADRIPDEHKDKAREYRDRTKNYFKGKFPQERRDQVIFRLKKMIVEIQAHSDYSQAIDTLLRLAEEYTGHSKNLASQAQGTVQGAHTGNDALHTAEADLKTLLERFANSTSFDDLIDSINQIYRDADQDPELKQWFKDADRFIRRCLQEQGYVIEEQSDQDWNRLYDKGNFLLRERYRNHTDRIADEFKFIGTQFDQDAQNTAFAQSMNKLFKDLGNDSEGQPEFKPHLIKDLTEVLLPAFFENVRYVPIPRIEYSDKMIDAIVENLVLEGDNLAPNQLEFGSDNFWRWGRKGIQNRNKNKVMLSASGIQMDLRDVAYYVKKKEGFPGITDKGVMDVFLGGTGFSFKVAMETADPSDRHHFFKINTVTVEIKNMNIKLKQSNHKVLFGLFKPLLLKVMRPVLQKVIEKQVRDSVHELDAYLYDIKKLADRAAEEAKADPDPDNAVNIYQRYFNAFQKRTQQAKEKGTPDVNAPKGQVNVAVTQHDSIFKNISLPGGISTKATEYKNLAEKGDKWESPVFSIGSAKETSGLPKPAQVSRKSHAVTQGGVRDPGASATSTAGGSIPGLDGVRNANAFGPTPTGGVAGGLSNPQGNYGTTHTGGVSNIQDNYGSTQVVSSTGGAGETSAPLQDFKPANGY